VTENGTKLIRYGTLTGTVTVLGEGLPFVNNCRVSPDGTKFVASFGGNLVVGDTTTGAYNTISGFKFGDWAKNGTRIMAVSTGNVITELSNTGTTMFEPIYNGSAGGGISDLDVNANSTKMMMTSAPAGWSRVGTIDISGGTQTYLTPNFATHTQCRWSPDGTKIVLTVGSGADTSIATIAPDGSAFTTIANDALPESDPVFAGNSVIRYTRSGSSGAVTQVYSMTVTGGSQASFYARTGSLRVLDSYEAP
jgi:hypothetical protein